MCGVCRHGGVLCFVSCLFRLSVGSVSGMVSFVHCRVRDASCLMHAVAWGKQKKKRRAERAPVKSRCVAKVVRRVLFGSRRWLLTACRMLLVLLRAGTGFCKRRNNSDAVATKSGQTRSTQQERERTNFSVAVWRLFVCRQSQPKHHNQVTSVDVPCASNASAPSSMLSPAPAAASVSVPATRSGPGAGG